MAELGRLERNGLITGGYPTKAQEILLTGPVEFKRGDVVGINSTNGSYALVDSSKSDGTQTPAGIICDDITVEGGATAVSTMYVKGEFANRFLRYGGTDTTENHLRYMTQIGLLVRSTVAEGGAYAWQ